MNASTIRQRTARLLEVSPDDPWSHRVDLALMALIGVNVIALVLQSVPSLAAQHRGRFMAFEWFSVSIFTLEYGLRVWSAIDHPDHTDRHPLRGRFRYMMSPLALIDLAAILPFYAGLLSGLNLSSLLVLRLVRVFKLARYSVATQALLQALRAEAESLAAAFFMLFILFLLASSGIYLIERHAQPQAFGSIPAAMWWAMATLTTVGYGDVVPVTPLGKFFGGCITIIGVGMVALPAGIIASGFSEHLRQRRLDSNDALSILLDREAPLADRRRAARLLGRNLQLSQRNRGRLLRAILAGDQKRPDPRR